MSAVNQLALLILPSNYLQLYCCFLRGFERFLIKIEFKIIPIDNAARKFVTCTSQFVLGIWESNLLLSDF